MQSDENTLGKVFHAKQAMSNIGEKIGTLKTSSVYAHQEIEGSWIFHKVV
jgi:RIO-like serine/threonine protein kinase